MLRTTTIRIFASAAALAALASLAGCGAAVGASCSKTPDCASGLECQCRGVGADPCGPDTPPEACAEARCGGRYCVDPKHPPPPMP